MFAAFANAHQRSWLCGTWYSAVFKVEQLRTLFVSKNIRSRVAMLISGSWNSVCIFLNTNVFYVLLNVYVFGSFICFGLIGFPFHMGSILRSIYADYRSLLFDKPPSQSFLGLRNALLREGTREEALRTSLWTTFCLAQFKTGLARNSQTRTCFVDSPVLLGSITSRCSGHSFPESLFSGRIKDRTRETAEIEPTVLCSLESNAFCVLHYVIKVTLH